MAALIKKFILHKVTNTTILLLESALSFLIGGSKTRLPFPPFRAKANERYLDPKIL